MKRLILTSSSGTGLTRSDLAEVVLPFTFRFIGGPLPSPEELATYVAARSDKHKPGSHWSHWWRHANKTRKDLRLIEFCQHYDAIELWFDLDPNDQLQLIWLLDYFGSYPEIASRLRMRLVVSELITADGERIGKWEVPVVDVTADELETASMAWQAYRATTPEGCFDLLGKDLSALPMLRPALLDLLEELPSRATGLGATEMRLLELIARGYSLTNATSISERSVRTACSALLKSVPCSRGSRTGRHPLWQGSTRSCAPLRGRTTGLATRHTSEAVCRSPNSARRFSPTRKTSAATTRSTAGGVAPD